MRKVLGDKEMKALRAQTERKFKTLKEVIQEIAKERQYYTDSDIREIWEPFQPYLDMEFEDLPLDLETHARWIVRKIVRWTGGNTNSTDEENVIELMQEILFNTIERFKEDLP
jgi:hypothetical protein